ncbi:MAG: hypothetical protein KJ709_01345 [Nanoarchaeota archaeon]|nr:hypothetical protein [Nanoarchaeota archaeon]
MKAYLGEPSGSLIFGPERLLANEDLDRAISCYQVDPSTTDLKLGHMKDPGSSGHPKIFELRVLHEGNGELGTYFKFGDPSRAPEEKEMSPGRFDELYETARYCQFNHLLEHLLLRLKDFDRIDPSDLVVNVCGVSHCYDFFKSLESLKKLDDINLEWLRKDLLRKAQAFKDYFPEYLESLEARMTTESVSG